MKLAIVVLLLLGACAPDPSTRPEARDGDDPPLSGAVKFEPYPGVQWYGPDGEVISGESNIINAITGPDHCEWESGVMMHAGWPMGHDAADISESRQYFRDPHDVFPQDHFMTTFDDDADLPKQARDTGYGTEFMELWLDPDNEKAAFLVFENHVERWPRGSEVIACA